MLGMAASTPGVEFDLPQLASRYVNVDELDWKETEHRGIRMQVLLEDPDTGLMTALVKMDPGAQLPHPEHVDIEQSFVLEGSLEDDQGAVTAGNYGWRPAGSRHRAWSPNGTLVLGFFLKPNRFF